MRAGADGRAMPRADTTEWFSDEWVVRTPPQRVCALGNAWAACCRCASVRHHTDPRALQRDSACGSAALHGGPSPAAPPQRFPGGLLHSHDNQLIAGLPRADRKHLLALCEPVHLVLAQVLGEPGQITRHVYFPTDGFVSLIAQVDAQHGLEVGMAGDEGMLGVHLALGVARDPLKALAQGGGLAWRLAAPAFRDEWARSAALRLRLQRYVSVLMAQRARAAACLRFHEIGPRLARWLLMSQDRAHADQFPLTQEFVATMLGVRLAAPRADPLPPRCADGGGQPRPAGRRLQLLRRRHPGLPADRGGAALKAAPAAVGRAPRRDHCRGSPLRFTVMLAPGALAICTWCGVPRKL